MTRRALLGCLVAVGLIVPAAGQAQAACAWQRTELPVPEFHVGTEVWGIGGEYAVGTTQHQGIKGIRWHNGQGTLLGVPSIDPNATAEPRDVNNSGVVAGTLETPRPDGTKASDAYIHRPDGSYQLMGSVTHEERATAINDRGDVAGYRFVDGEPKAVVWWATDYSRYQVIGTGVPVGIDNNKVVTSGGLMSTKLSSGLFAGRRMQKPAGADAIVVSSFDGGLPAGWSSSPTGHQAIVWNATGSIRSATPGLGYTANNFGTVVGVRNGDGQPALWRNGTVDTLPSPAPRMIPGRVFIDSRDIISGTYVGLDNQAGAAQWRCS